MNNFTDALKQRNLEELGENDPDALIFWLDDGEALISKEADNFTNWFKSAADFIKWRLNH